MSSSNNGGFLSVLALLAAMILVVAITVAVTRTGEPVTAVSPSPSTVVRR